MSASFVISEGSPTYLLGIYLAFVVVNAFIEYGLDVIDESVKGNVRPPSLEPGMVMITVGNARFLKQLFMILLFCVAAKILADFGFIYGSVAVLIFLLFLLPASLAINAVYENFADMINPDTLIRLVLTIKGYYLVAVGIFAAFPLGIYIFKPTGAVIFLLGTPVFLYSLILAFRILGVGIYSQKDKFIEAVDFAGEKVQLLRDAQRDENLYKLLERAYWLTKENKIDEAEKMLLPALKIDDWARFNAAFSRISRWPGSELALRIIDSYLTYLLEKGNYTEIFNYSQWCLKKDPGFSIKSESGLSELVLHAEITDQFETAV